MKCGCEDKGRSLASVSSSMVGRATRTAKDLQRFFEKKIGIGQRRLWLQSWVEPYEQSGTVEYVFTETSGSMLRVGHNIPSLGHCVSAQAVVK